MAAFIKGFPGSTSLDDRFITDYLPEADGEFVKIYIYGLMRASSGDGECPFGADALARAYAYWQSVGLVRIVSAEPLTVEYLSLERKLSSDAPRKYASLIAKLSEVAGTRPFTGHELSEIYDWIEVYRFSEDAAVMCVKDAVSRHGARAKLYQLNAEAKLWADNGVVTKEDAEAYIKKRDSYNAGAQRILHRWKRYRMASDDELALYAKWTDEWGFDDTVILDACAECTSAAQPSFKYLDTVLETYRLNGALTPEKSAELRRERDELRDLAMLLVQRAGIKRAPSQAQRDDVAVWRGRDRMEAELLFLAADEAGGAQQPWATMKKLISEWRDAGIASVPDAKALLERRKSASKRKEATRRGRAAVRSERKYSDEELKKLGVDLLDE